MAETTEIAWCDATFNPWIGCAKVAPGCTNCYAEALSKRFNRAAWGPHGTRVKTSESYWRQPLKWNRNAEREGVRRRVFCASLADVFEDWDGPIVDSKGIRLMHDCGEIRSDGQGESLTMDDLRRDLFTLIDKTPWLDWLLLTKRPENVRRMWPRRVAETFPVGQYIEEELKARGWTTRDCAERMGGQVDVNELTLDLHVAVLDSPPDHPIQRGYMGAATAKGLERATGVDSQTWLNLDRAHREGVWHRSNVWLGTSISDQATADQNVPELLKCGDLCPVLFLSAEPLLGEVNLDANRMGVGPWHDEPWFGGISWVIIGGESGHHARPCNVEWIRSLGEQCQAAKVACFVKQLGAKPRGEVTGRDGLDWPEGTMLSGEDCVPINEFTALATFSLRDKKGGNWDEWPADLRVREFPEP